MQAWPRRKSLERESKASPVTQFSTDDHTPKMSPYELSREERIKANLERMQQLGLVDLSLKLKSFPSPSNRTPRFAPSSTKQGSSPPPSGPLRRSSRLQNATPVSYSEAVSAKKDGLLGNEKLLSEVGSRPEVYTEEHEKLLGNTERSWTLFVDGYGSDGKRIYDQFKGKTCHQCRQKTLGCRTHCSQCHLVQGQFCGDCLYIRYGEHVLEAIENSEWICPVCRGICNCSLCRVAKGWTPTGPIYRKISRLGYKSVAHYLIQTRRAKNDVPEDSVNVNQVSVKRSLPFSDMEAPSTEHAQININQPDSMEKATDDLKIGEKNEISSSGNSTSNEQTRTSLHLSDGKPQQQCMESDGLARVDETADITLGINNMFSNEEVKKEKEAVYTEGGQHTCSSVAPENGKRPKNRLCCTAEANPDSIGARLRQRRRMSKTQDEESTGTNEQQTSDVEQISKSISSSKKVKVEKKPTRIATPLEDSIVRRLRPR